MEIACFYNQNRRKQDEAFGLPGDGDSPRPLRSRGNKPHDTGWRSHGPAPETGVTPHPLPLRRPALIRLSGLASWGHRSRSGL